MRPQVTVCHPVSTQPKLVSKRLSWLRGLMLLVCGAVITSLGTYLLVTWVSSLRRGDPVIVTEYGSVWLPLVGVFMVALWPAQALGQRTSSPRLAKWMGWTVLALMLPALALILGSSMLIEHVMEH